MAVQGLLQERSMQRSSPRTPYVDLYAPSPVWRSQETNPLIGKNPEDLQEAIQKLSGGSETLATLNAIVQQRNAEVDAWNGRASNYSADTVDYNSAVEKHNKKARKKKRPLHYPKWTVRAALLKDLPPQFGRSISFRQNPPPVVLFITGPDIGKQSFPLGYPTQQITVDALTVARKIPDSHFIQAQAKWPARCIILSQPKEYSMPPTHEAPADSSYLHERPIVALPVQPSLMQAQQTPLAQIPTSYQESLPTLGPSENCYSDCKTVKLKHSVEPVVQCQDTYQYQRQPFACENTENYSIVEHPLFHKGDTCYIEKCNYAFPRRYLFDWQDAELTGGGGRVFSITSKKSQQTLLRFAIRVFPLIKETKDTNYKNMISKPTTFDPMLHGIDYSTTPAIAAYREAYSDLHEAEELKRLQASILVTRNLLEDLQMQKHLAAQSKRAAKQQKKTHPTQENKENLRAKKSTKTSLTLQITETKKQIKELEDQRDKLSYIEQTLTNYDVWSKVQTSETQLLRYDLHCQESRLEVSPKQVSGVTIQQWPVTQFFAPIETPSMGATKVYLAIGETLQDLGISPEETQQIVTMMIQAALPGGPMMIN